MSDNNELYQEKKTRVSILLPNLNNYRYLKERLDTILNQTYTDWELIVIDSYSNDGAWELIKQYAENDSRMTISQAPKEGVYAAINKCINLAQGEYIYIATSDDTMMPNCLEVMINALEIHPECDICHTPLQVIDEKGEEITNWWLNTPPAKFYDELINKPHVRYAPYDGILYSALRTVYISLTQLLIRRSVFDKVGLFCNDWGSEGDFEWGMRASLVCNIIHIPETLATWRIHAQQATQYNPSYEQREKLAKMVNSALTFLKEKNPPLYAKLIKQKLLSFYRREQFYFGFQECQTRYERLKYILKFATISPYIVKEYFGDRLLGRKVKHDEKQEIREILTKLDLDKCIKILD